jgi:hypothetical protein
MASATFENLQALRTARAASRAGRAGTSAALRNRESGRAEVGGSPRRRAESIRVPAIWRGVGASVAVASGYVAFVAGIRWLFLMV